MVEAAILVCTCDRPELLRKLLTALAHPDEVKAPVCIIDNGAAPAHAVIEEFRDRLVIHERRVPERGLVAARNAGLRLALAQSPRFIAFIDDDEYPAPGWLAELLRAMAESGAGFVTGPVIPDYAAPPPRWAVNGGYFQNGGDAFCTSNLMIRTDVIPPEEAQWFHPDFNLLGGEDNEFLGRLAAGGVTHALAPAAAVHERIPPARLNRRYVWRRGLRDGMAEARIAALRPGSRLGRLTALALRKFGYASNHLFWTPFEPWRINSALADWSFILGLLLGSLGVRGRFYGARPANG